jgi:DNA-binding XRE family transcriptional regulator
MTSASPLATLAATLRTVAASPVDIADRDLRGAFFRARAGKPINAGAYLALCGAVGLDPVDGSPRPIQRVPAHVSWPAVGAGLKIIRQLRGQDQRSAAKAIGISAATLCRVEAGDAASVDTLLAVCSFIGTHPDHYSTT